MSPSSNQRSVKHRYIDGPTNRSRKFGQEALGGVTIGEAHAMDPDIF